MSGVIAVMKFNVQTAADDRVADDDAHNVGSCPQQFVGDSQEAVEAAQPVERAGHERNDPRFFRDDPASNRPRAAAGGTPCRASEAARVDPVV